MKKFRSVFCVILCVMLLTTVFSVAAPVKTNASPTVGQIEVKTNKKLYKNNEPTAITIRNTGNTTIEFEAIPKLEIWDKQGNLIYPSSKIKRPLTGDPRLWELKPGEQEIYVIDPHHLPDQEWPGEETTIRFDNTVGPDIDIVGDPSMRFQARGVVILVCGNDHYVYQSNINEGCNRIYDDLKCIGYEDDDIYYLNSEANWRVDDIASSAILEDAIINWAGARANIGTPLFLVMFDHGDIDSLSLDRERDVGGLIEDEVRADDLNDWFTTLESDTGAEIFTLIVACRSGSFIDDLYGEGRVTITTCMEDESSSTLSNMEPYWEYFSMIYWPLIKWGFTLGDAFNGGSWFTSECSNQYHPLLDDDGFDGDGHGWNVPDDNCGDLPHHGDGNLAFNVTMGDKICPFKTKSVIIKGLLEGKHFLWPLSDPYVTIWAEIQSIDPLMHVKASMIPPDWVPPNASDTLTQIPLVDFEMEDPEGDGIWNVDIPAEEFMKHATGPTDFQFIITAEDEEGRTMIPCMTSVRFLAPGAPPPPDNVPPRVLMMSPLPGQIAQGTMLINGIASDDVCLQKIEIFASKQLLDTQDIQPSSNSYFEFDLDTALFPDGESEIWVRITDTSGNTFEETIPVTIVNDPVQFLFTQVDVHPETLNLKNKGKWVSCNINPPEYYEDPLVDPKWLVLNGDIPAENQIQTGDSLNVKFDRPDLEDMLSPQDDAVLTVAGELGSGEIIAGTDTIRVIDPGK
ncbi:MAG: hypothetical protein JSV56_10335 [Methanomassiliicoccales archaeon]|nr:MAG: hypothetical protein JSV56_10335 [Methanomassiliicoccales archaeon]